LKFEFNFAPRFSHQTSDLLAMSREQIRKLTLLIDSTPLKTSNHRSFSCSVVGRWALDVERWTFSFSRRVKGAWPFNFAPRFSHQTSKFKPQTSMKGGESQCRGSKFASSRRFHLALGEQPN